MSKHDRYIFTNKGAVAIPDGMEGVPAEEYFGKDMPKSLKGSKVYEIDGKRYIANQELMVEEEGE